MFTRVEDTSTGHQFDLDSSRVEHMVEAGHVKLVNDDERWPETDVPRPALTRTNLAGEPAPRPSDPGSTDAGQPDPSTTEPDAPQSGADAT